MNKRYNELLKDGRWQMKRIKILERDHFMCARCGRSAEEGTQLHVHHKFYDGRAPWGYEDKDLITLCEDCHNRIHGKSDDIKPGDLIQYDHSDSTNTGFVYYANKEKDLVCTLTYDNLCSTESIWLEYWKWDIFLKRTEKASQEDVLRYELFEDWLVNVYFNIHHAERKYSLILNDVVWIIERNPVLSGIIDGLSFSDREKVILDKGEERLSVYTVEHYR